MEKVRVRFAPSPTGKLHLGGARTALFNFLFARSQKGVFILRIEDTDKERSKREYEEDIIESLNWLRLYYDEGPVRQSERIDLYEKVIKTLIEKDLAYYCFCRKEELELKKQEFLTRGQVPIYPGTCRNLDKNEVKEKLRKGFSYTIRLKVPDKIITFKDYLRGVIKFDLKQIGDFIIAKNEKEPLYVLANTVDDHYQGITHVLRGEEFISTTPKQLLIYKYMNWGIPIFVHLPLILGPGRTKLSKRHGAKSISEYREEGYLPEAILNFIALLGWHPEGDKEIVSLEEMIKEFKLEKINKSSSIFNEAKLNFFNKYYIKRRGSQDLLGFLDFSKYGEWKDNVFYAKNEFSYSYEKILKIIELGKERAITTKDILDSVSFFFEKFDYNPELLLWKNTDFSKIKNNLIKTRDELSKIDENNFVSLKIKEVLDEISQENKGEYFWPLRVALSGKETSPPPQDLAEIYGKNNTLFLVEKAINKLR